MKLNEINDEIVDIVDDIKNEFDIDIVEYLNNDIFIDIIEFDDDELYDDVDELLYNDKFFKMINYINNKYDVYIDYYYNKNNKLYELNIIDPINKPIIFNDEFLIKIFNENIDTIDNLFECNILSIKTICNDLIYDLFKTNKYNVSSYDILKLFENIIELTNKLNIENKNNDDELIECYELFKLFEYIIDDLYKKVNEFDIYKTFKLSLINSYENINILTNNHYYINNDTLFNNIDENIILYDLNENIDDELIELLDINYDNNINTYLFYEYNLINSLNNDLNTNINYIIEYNDDDIVVENSIEISIDDIIKLNNQISNNTSNINRIVFDIIEYINELFENVNNSYEFDEFIYLLFENEFEILYNNDIFYNDFYYTIGSNYNNKYSIYDLKKYVLNYLSNLNLNKSFKFDDELYNII